MDKQSRRSASRWSAILIGVATLALILLIVFATGVFSPNAPLRTSAELPECGSAEVQEGVAAYLKNQVESGEVTIVSIQEVGRQQGLDGGPMLRRDCQVNLKTAAGYERVIAELSADGSPDGAAWTVRLTEPAAPPVATQLEGAPPPTPVEEQVPTPETPAPAVSPESQPESTTPQPETPAEPPAGQQ